MIGIILLTMNQGIMYMYEISNIVTLNKNTILL